MKYITSLLLVVLLFSATTSLQAQKNMPNEHINLIVIHDKKLSEEINMVQEEVSQQVEENRFIGLATLGSIAYNMIMGKLVSGATGGVEKAIERGRAKYNAEWTASVSKDYFYNNVSFNGPFDPSGMQFGGMKTVRLLPNEANPTKLDTAFYFSCHVDKERISDLLKNSRFGLVLDTLLLDLSKTKAKLPRNRKFNLDVNIRITASWVNQATQYFKDQELGNFQLTLKNIVYDPEHPIYICTDGKDGANLEGSCFIVPRSYCGYIEKSPDSDKEIYRNLWGQGEYTMEITVKEQTENKSMVKDLFNEYMIKVVETYGNEIKNTYTPGNTTGVILPQMQK